MTRVGEQKLQQESLLKRIVVVVGDQINHRAFGRFLDRESFEILRDQRLLDFEQFLAAEFGARLDRFRVDPRHTRRQDTEGHIAPFEHQNIAIF